MAQTVTEVYSKLRPFIQRQINEAAGGGRGQRPGGYAGVVATIIATGTTGNQTINERAGRVNIAAAGTAITVTNSYVSAGSIVLVVVATADATARVTSVVSGAGSFTINTVAVTAETAFGFLVVN